MTQNQVGMNENIADKIARTVTQSLRSAEIYLLLLYILVCV